MRKAEKCVAIAKDVRKQLKVKKYKAKTGQYVLLTVADAKKVDTKIVEFREAIKPVKKCQVCALGACFVSAARVFDKVKTVDVGIGKYDWYARTRFTEVMPHLSNFFAKKQLALIECAFEGWGIPTDEERQWMYPNDSKLIAGCSEAVAYKRKYQKPADRLDAIMRNIIRNKGKFVLPGVK